MVRVPTIRFVSDPYVFCFFALPRRNAIQSVGRPRGPKCTKLRSLVVELVFSSLFRFPLASSRSFPPRAPFGAPVLAKIRNQNPQSGRSRKKTRNRTCYGHVRSWGRPIAAGFGVQNAMVSDGVGAVSLFFVFSKDFDWKALFLQGVSIKKRWLFRPWPLPTRPGAQNRCLFKGF